MPKLRSNKSTFEAVSDGRTAPVGCGSKRVFDVLVAATGILVLAPLLVFCYLVIVGSSRGPGIFRHRRIGFNGQPFDCMKFRTMAIDSQDQLSRLLQSDPKAAAEWSSAQKLLYDPRVTFVGAALRKSSLDELPQLFNVLRGEMSIVGPRPVTEQELLRYGRFVAEYLACRPGLTGLWQVSGRNATTYARRVALDAFYSRNWSHKLDLKILLVTIPTLIFAYGAY